MNYLIISGMIGVLSGVFSVYRPRTFTIFLLMSVLTGLLFIQSGGPINLVAELSGVRGVKELWTVFQDFYSDMSKDAQIAVMMFPALFIAARIMAWLKLNFFTRDESRAKQKRRVLKKYGFQDGIPD